MVSLCFGLHKYETVYKKVKFVLHLNFCSYFFGFKILQMDINLFSSFLFQKKALKLGKMVLFCLKVTLDQLYIGHEMKLAQIQNCKR